MRADRSTGSNSKMRTRPFSGSVLHREDRPAAGFTYGRTARVGRTPMDGMASAPHAIDFAFLAHERTVVEHPGGRIEDRRIPPGTGSAVGADAVRFLETDGPSEFVELRPAPWLRAEVLADLRCAGLADHEAEGGIADPALLVAATRVRAHASGGTPITSLEVEQLTRNVLSRVFERLGAGPRPKARRGLAARRLARVTGYIEANLACDLRLTALADEAAVSRFHFNRMFRIATGATPHAFVTMRRMERAMDLLRAGHPVGPAARSVGYGAGHSFRRAFRLHHGIDPGRALLAGGRGR